MSLSVFNLNVYPYLLGGTVTNNEGGGVTGYAMTAHNVSSTLVAFPSVGSGGTAGVFVPSSSTPVAGWVDGDKGKWFYTDGHSVALPTLVSVTQTQISDTAGLRGGPFTVKVSYAANDPQVNGPSAFVLSEIACLIIASTPYG